MGGAVASMAESMGAGMAAGMNMTMSPPPSGMPMPMPMHRTKMMMHMTFFWGSRVDILFSNWPGDRGLAVYLLALLLVFVAAFFVELLSFFPRPRRLADKRLPAGLVLTGLSAVRTGLSYLVMLAVMSFNVGVLLAAVAGHAFGFFVFGTGLFFRPRDDDERDGAQHVNGRRAVVGDKC